MIFPTHGLIPATSSSTATPANTRPTARIPSMQAATVAAAGGGRVRIGILRSRHVAPPLTQQLAPVLGVQDLVALRLERVHLFAVSGELGTEVADALVRLVLFSGVELLLREGAVLVDGLLKGRQRRAEGAERRGGEDIGGGAERRRGWVGGGGWANGEVGEIFSDGCALLESTVEGCVLWGCVRQFSSSFPFSYVASCLALAQMGRMVDLPW